MIFGEKLKVAREKTFMSQQSFAKELGVSFTTLNHWETEKCEPQYKAKKLFHDFCEKYEVKIGG